MDYVHNTKAVTFVIPSLAGGGMERVIVNLANVFYDSGYEVDLLILGTVEGPFVKAVNKGIHIIPLELEKAGNHYHPFFRARNVFSAVKVLCYVAIQYLAHWNTMVITFKNYLRKRTPHVLICNNFSAAVIAAVHQLPYQQPVIIVEHNTYSQAIVASMHGLVHFFFIRIRTFFYRKASAIVSVSQGVRDDLLKNGITSADKAYVIYNPVVDKKLCEQASIVPQHPWLKKKLKPVFISIGRLSAQKNYSHLLKAFALVLQKVDAYLLILGEGELRAELQELSVQLKIETAISMPGFVENPYSYLKHADVFVLSSRFEGLPTVLIEALACGITPVSTRCPSGPEEIIEDGRYGYLVPVDDVEVLADAMYNAINYPLDADVLQRRATDFSVESAFRAYEDLIWKLTP